MMMNNEGSVLNPQPLFLNTLFYRGYTFAVLRAYFHIATYPTIFREITLVVRQNNKRDNNNYMKVATYAKFMTL